MRAVPRQKPGRSRQDYGTPAELLGATKRLLRIKDFDIDLAASPSNAVTRRYYTERENALVQPWKVGDGWNWLNPPFARIEPWVKRALEQIQWGAQTAVLVPAAVGSNWWRDYVHGKAHVLFMNGRPTFVGESDPYPKDCCLLLYGPTVKPTYQVWCWMRTMTRAA